MDKLGKLQSVQQYLPGMTGDKAAAALQTAVIKRQADIVRAMTVEEKAHGEARTLGSDAKARISAAVGCSVQDVDDMLKKYHWTKTAFNKLAERQKAGLPTPTSFQEMERLMGGDWKGGRPGARALPGEKGGIAVSGGTSEGPGRYAPCPCGSGKKYRHCCKSKDERAAKKNRK